MIPTSVPPNQAKGAVDKANVMVSVETREEKAGFAKMHQVHTLNAHYIHEMPHEALGEEVVVRSGKA